MTEEYLTAIQVCQKFQIHRRTLQRYVEAEFFPKPIRLGPRTVRFRASDIEALGDNPVHERGGGAIASGWIQNQPDVEEDDLVSVIDEDCLDDAERAELRGK